MKCHRSIFVAAALLLPFGTPAGYSQTATEEFGENESEFEAHANAPEAISQAGIRWVRLTAFWRWMQPTEGGLIDWAEMDKKVNNAVDSDLSILIDFVSIPSWVNGTSPSCVFFVDHCSMPFLPNHLNDWPNFVSAVVSRYKDRVQHWEIWNEPDYFAFWDADIPTWVSQVLNPGVSAIRAADSTAKVIGPATFKPDSVNSSFAAWAGASCSQLDYLSQHFYVGDTTTMFSRIDNSWVPWITAFCNKPLWITETGIDSLASGEASQASNYVEALEGAASRSSVARMFLFHWADPNPPGPPTERWGMMERDSPRDNRPKRAFFEIRDYTNTLKGLANRTVVRDTFANEGTSREPGDLLSGTQAEVSNRAWQADSTVVMGNSEITRASGAATTHTGGISFAPPADPNLPLEVVEADVEPTSSNWVALGFTSAATGGFWGIGQLWVHLGPDGGFGIYVNGLTHLLKTGIAQEFHATSPNHVKIKYNRTLNVATVEINGRSELFYYDLDAVPFTPSLAFAGFHIEMPAGAQAGQVTLDNFVLSSMPEVVLFLDGFEPGNFSAWSSFCQSGC